MKDHEKRELISELVGIARIAHGAEQLRDRIAYALSGVFLELDEATARAERSEAQLKAAREPIYFFRQHGVQTSWLECSDSKQAVQLRDLGFQVRALYAAPIPAPAAQAPQDATCEKPLQVPNEWREVLSGLIAIAEKKGKKQGSPNHSHRRTNIWDDDNGPELSGKPCAECALYDRARALLQEVKP